MNKGRLFVISGPSGAGKGTICKKVLSEHTDLNVSISVTTRPKREGEVHGENYFFVSPEEFERIRQEDGFLEHACVYENYYGTPKKAVLDTLSQGKDVVLEIDIQGAMSIKQAYPDGIFIYILPPSLAELTERIRTRGTESESAIQLRMSKAMSEISYIDKYDYCVINGDLESATEVVKAIILAEHARVPKDIYEIIDRYKEEI
ncbi:MAG: guanylate kinase [Anaerovoracaceae bacterium]|jgi:guanylate kinase